MPCAESWKIKISMGQQYSKQDEERFESYRRVHLKKSDEGLSREDEIELLQKKNRNRWWLLLLNVVAIVFFGYSFASGITQLSDTLFYILIAVFIINVGLIFYQKKQLSELIEFLKWKQQNER